MPVDKLTRVLAAEIEELESEGTAKGAEQVVTEVLPADGDRGPRVRLAGEGDALFLRMNSNGYLGLGSHAKVIEAEEAATRAFGAGPGAVRFISGTYRHHVELEAALAGFHGREAAMLSSSAYATTVGTLVPLITRETAVVSDALNHNCIINAMRLARPASKEVYAHLDLGELEAALGRAAEAARRALVVTDGIFSMRGDHAPVDEIAAIVARWDERFEEGALLVVDDSHGVGAFGDTGRGTEEHCGSAGASDLLIATLGKALGVNGGYVAGNATLIRYLREKAPMYIYSNPITVGEAAAASAALAVLDSPEGRDLLTHLRAMTRRFERGLLQRGFETIPGEHPVVPLVVRDTARTRALVDHLHGNRILATGLAFPVVPAGEEEIRFQISADHTAADVDRVLDVLSAFDG